MESSLIKILDILQASPADYFVFFCGMLVVMWILLLVKRVKEVERANRQLDKLVLLHGHIIRDRLGITTVKVHRSGDYQIEQPLNEE